MCSLGHQSLGDRAHRRKLLVRKHVAQRQGFEHAEGYDDAEDARRPALCVTQAGRPSNQVQLSYTGFKSGTELINPYLTIRLAIRSMDAVFRSCDQYGSTMP